MRISPPSLAALLLLAPSAAAEILTVGLPGSGSDFTSVVAAIGAANDGDTVFVGPGNYVETATLVIDRPLTLMGSGSLATTVLVQLDGYTFAPAALLIENLAQGETASAIGIGFDLEGAAFPFTLPSHIAVRNCAGSVLVQDAVAPAATGYPNMQTVLVEDSDSVLFENVSFSGSTLIDNSGRTALRSNRSSVWLHEAKLIGGNAPGGFFVFPADYAVRSFDSVLRASDSILVGGSGIATFSGNAGGQRAVLLEQSQLILRGATLVLGGSGEVGGSSSGGPGASGVEVSVGSLLTATPGVVIAAGPDSDGMVTQPGLVVSGGQVASVPQGLATLSSSPGQASEGDAVSFSSSGEPGSIATLYRGAPASALQLSGPLGPVLLAPGTLTAFAPQTIGASGSAVRTLTVPTGAGLGGSAQRFQSLVVTPGGLTSISNAAHVSIMP